MWVWCSSLGLMLRSAGAAVTGLGERGVGFPGVWVM